MPLMKWRCLLFSQFYYNAIRSKLISEGEMKESETLKHKEWINISCVANQILRICTNFFVPSLTICAACLNLGLHFFAEQKLINTIYVGCTTGSH